MAGSAGQLGRELALRLGDELAWAGGRAELDVTDAAAVAALVARVRPDVVFNATAYNRVDAAEGEPERAFAVNALAPRTLALAAREAGALLVHVSTDYVFDGAATRPYREDDPAAAALGLRRLEARGRAARARLRGRGPGGAHERRPRAAAAPRRRAARSWTASWRRRARASPCASSRTRSSRRRRRGELAGALVALVRLGARGLFHVTNEGACSWHELATAALAAAGLERAVEPISAAELRLPARRPAYSVLDTSRAGALGLPPLRPWQDALAELVA